MKMLTSPQLDFSKPSLEALAFLLRNERLWPKGYRWDFNTLLDEDFETVTVGYRRRSLFLVEPIEEARKCGSTGCAIGLAHELWPQFKESEHRLHTEDAAEAFGISRDDAAALFFDTYAYYGGCEMEDVTPLMVADAIDRFLAEGSIV